MSAYEELLRDKRIDDGILHERFNEMPAAARAVVAPDGKVVAGGTAKP
jgi:hypothetical protein